MGGWVNVATEGMEEENKKAEEAMDLWAQLGILCGQQVAFFFFFFFFGSVSSVPASLNLGQDRRCANDWVRSHGYKIVFYPHCLFKDMMSGKGLNRPMNDCI